MVIHFEVDPKKCSYQFLSEIALFDPNPENLAEIYDTIVSTSLRPTDGEFGACSFTDIDCCDEGVKEALCKNPKTDYDTIKKISQDPDDIIRSTVARFTAYSDIIYTLLDEEYLFIMLSVLNNPNLVRGHFKKIYTRLINDEFDFDMAVNHDTTSKAEFAKKLSECKLATIHEVLSIGKWLARQPD